MRAANDADVPDIQRISRATGQPPVDSGADAGYVRHILQIGSAVVAEAEGRTLGWAATTSPGPGSMLSDLFVAPGDQGRGAGSALLAALWPDTPDAARFTFSSSHPTALTSYLRAGLLPRWPLLYLEGPPLTGEGMPAVVPVPAADAAAAEGDATGHAQRSADYRYWTSHLGAEAFVVTQDGALAAAGARTSARVLHLACRDDADGARAVLACLGDADQSAGKMRICLPGPHPALRMLAESGYRVLDHDTAMATEAVALATTHAYSPALA